MGMSVSNLWAMKKYYVRFHLSDPKLQRSVGVLPWRHINQLMTKLKDDDNAIQYYAERSIEKGWNCDLLVNAIKLAYIGNQHVLSYNGKDYKVDMLFFHRGLRSLVAIDLNISEFMPEYVSKMNLYLSLLDRLERGKDENPSIGIILCAEKDNVEVELALEGFTKPIGVAEYKLIVPQKELKQLITDEIKTFNQEVADKSAELSDRKY